MTLPAARQKHIVVVGATGMVGGYVLRDTLASPDVGSVTAIGRRSVGVSHPKLREVLHRDFSDCSALKGALVNQDAAIFCLGAYTGAVSGAELRTITVDYTAEFVRVLYDSSPNAAFSFLSGAGADPTETSRIAFARYKGAAENAVVAAGLSPIYIFRPAYIYPVEPRKEPNFGYRLLRALYPVFRMILPSQTIPADDLAFAMMDVVLHGTAARSPTVCENRDIRAMVDQRRNARARA